MDSLPVRELQRSTEWIPRPRGGQRPARGLDEWLQVTALRLGASVAVWVGPNAEAQVWPRLRARGVDWKRVRRLAPGRIESSTDWAHSSARSAAADLRMLWIAAPIGAQGTGRLGLGMPIVDAPAAFESWPREALLGLVDGAWLACRLQREVLQGLEAKPVRVLGERAAGLLHDLRNQLTLVSLASGLVEMEPAGESQQAAEAWEQVQGLIGEARNMCAGALVGDPGRVESLLLGQLLHSEVRAATQTAEQRSGKLGSARVRCAMDLEIGTRPMALSRLVRNLVLNALQASDPERPVDVSAEALSGGRVQLLVEDQGRGMDPNELRRMFEPGRSGSGGTGFGTASLRSCLEDLEAEMSISSTRGEGTRVRILLGNLCVGGEQRVVLLDPDPKRRLLRRSALAETGWNVSAHALPSSAESALVGGDTAALVLARGASGGGLASLLARAEARAVPTHILPAGACGLEILNELRPGSPS
ncbi:MAG: signal transduction histidine kinase [Planctomycetota bacterium]|jgi:signal transduction histidine kinase